MAKKIGYQHLIVRLLKSSLLNWLIRLKKIF